MSRRGRGERDKEGRGKGMDLAKWMGNRRNEEGRKGRRRGIG